ncbi:MAG: extracellular solute-binding protein [Acetobacteraceae bacterium]
MIGSISRRNVLKGTGGLATAAALTAPRRARAQKKSIRVLLVADPFYYALTGVAKQFTEETGIAVNIESLSYDALNARLVTSFLSSRPDADVISVDNIWLGQYLESKWVKPFNDLIKADKDINIKDFIPAVIYSINEWRGQIGTMPVAPYGMGVMYRKDYAEAAGVKVPDDGSWTWDQYFDMIKKLNGQTFSGQKMFGTVVAGQQPAPIVHMFTQLAASMGARWFKHFPEAPWDFTPTIDSKENIEAIALFRDLYKNSPPESVNYNWFDAGMRFAKGDIGMYYWWSAYFYLCRKNGYMSGKKSVVADNMGIVPLPHSSHPQVVSIGGWGLGMPANSMAQEEAWTFIKWATSAKAQKAMALYDKYGHQFSDFARHSLYVDPELLKIYPYLPMQLTALETGNGKISRPGVPTYTTLESIYGLDLNKVLTGALSPEECAKQTTQFWTNVLKGNFMIPYRRPSYDDTLDATKALIASLA